MTKRQRRKFMRAVGVAGLAGIAGCSGLLEDSTNSPGEPADRSAETTTSEVEIEQLRRELSSTVTTAWEKLAPAVAAFEQFQPPITGDNREAIRQVNDQLEQVSDSLSQATDLANRIEAKLEADDDATLTPETEAALEEYQDVGDAFLITAEATVAVWGMGWLGLWLTGVESRWRRFSLRSFPTLSQDTFAETFVDRVAGEYASIVTQSSDKFAKATGKIASQADPGSDAPTPGEAAPDVTVEWGRLRSALEYVENNSTRLGALVRTMSDLYRLIADMVDIDTGSASSNVQIDRFSQQVRNTRRQLGEVTSAVMNAAEQTDTEAFDVEPETYPAALETLRTGLEAYQTDLDRWAEEPARYRNQLKRPLLGAGNRIFAESEFYLRTPAGRLVERGLIPRDTVVLSGDPDRFIEQIRAELDGAQWDEQVIPHGESESVTLTTQIQNGSEGSQQAVFDPSVVEVTPGTEVQLRVPEAPTELLARIAEEFADGDPPTAYRLNGERFEEPPLSTSVTYDWPQLDIVVSRAIWPENVQSQMPPAFRRFPFATAGVVVDGPGVDWNIEF